MSRSSIACQICFFLHTDHDVPPKDSIETPHQDSNVKDAAVTQTYNSTVFTWSNLWRLRSHNNALKKKNNSPWHRCCRQRSKTEQDFHPRTYTTWRPPTSSICHHKEADNIDYEPPYQPPPPPRCGAATCRSPHRCAYEPPTPPHPRTSKDKEVARPQHPPPRPPLPAIANNTQPHEARRHRGRPPARGHLHC